MSVHIGPLTRDDPEYSRRNVEFDLDHMIMSSDGQRRKFDANSHVHSVHCPEMKNITIDMCFLSGLEVKNVVYIGTSPLRHMKTLASLFTKMTFHVYHPSPAELKGSNIVYKGTQFDQKAVEEWSQIKQIAMISDVRTLKEASEEEVKLTMHVQLMWLRQVKPLHWACNFRIPVSYMRENKVFPYLQGRLYYTPFARSLSPELRLVGHCGDFFKPLTPYKAREIEQRMVYHNTVIRPNRKLYANVLRDTLDKYSDETFDNSYDCSYFLSVIKFYAGLKHAIARPSSEEGILEFAKRVMGWVVR